MPNLNFYIRSFTLRICLNIGWGNIALIEGLSLDSVEEVDLLGVAREALGRVVMEGSVGGSRRGRIMSASQSRWAGGGGCSGGERRRRHERSWATAGTGCVRSLRRWVAGKYTTTATIIASTVTAHWGKPRSGYYIPNYMTWHVVGPFLATWYVVDQYPTI